MPRAVRPSTITHYLCVSMPLAVRPCLTERWTWGLYLSAHCAHEGKTGSEVGTSVDLEELQKRSFTLSLSRPECVFVALNTKEAQMTTFVLNEVHPCAVPRPQSTFRLIRSVGVMFVGQQLYDLLSRCVDDNAP